MSGLAVAAISARMLAEAARAEGFGVVALDLFGDADTRRACSQWWPIGDARPETAASGRSLEFDGPMLLAALRALAQRGDVTGWIAGSGFEGRPELLERGAALLPLIGTPAGAVRQVRDPSAFFGFLHSAGIAHPQVRMAAPDGADGWLVKDAHGCGGWHIRRADEAGAAAASEPGRHYFQREAPGVSMSATFIANGSEARVLGFNHLIVRPFGRRPFVYCGAVGPVALPAAVASRLQAAVGAIAAQFSLRGLGSMDFLLDDGEFQVLEINPRPPASMALYGRCAARAPSTRRRESTIRLASWMALANHSRARRRSLGAGSAPRGGQGTSGAALRFLVAPAHGVVTAHVHACVRGELPNRAMRAAGGSRREPVQGSEIVFAPEPLSIDDRAARRLSECAACHDLPAGAMRFEAGDPVCSVSAAGASIGHVRSLLDRRREAVLQLLETHR